MRFSLPISFLLLSCGLLHAQAPLEPALTAGYEFGVPLEIQRTPDLVNRFSAAGYGTAYNHTLRGGFQIGLPLPLAPALRLSLVGSTGRFSSDTFSTSAGLSGDSVRPRQFDVASQTLAVAAELRARFEPVAGWSLELGPTISYRLLGSFVETERFVDGVDIASPNGDGTVARGGEIAAPPLRYGLVMSIAPEIRIGERTTIRPGLEARFDLGAMELGPRALSGGVGITLRLDAPQEIPADSPPDDPRPDDSPVQAPSTDTSAPVAAAPSVDTPLTATVAPTVDSPSSASPVNRVPRLVASIDLFAVDGGRRVERAMLVPMQMVTSARHYLPGIITFDSASAELGSRYRLLDAADVDDWTPPVDLLRNRGAIHTELLNVIADRMRQEPRARIVLEGFAGNSETDRGLLQARLQCVRRYLVETWRIDDGSVQIVHPATASGQVRRSAIGGVAIRSGPGPRIDAPFADQWTSRVVRTPKLDMEPRIEAEAGLRNWTLVVSHMGRTIARRSSEGAELGGTTELLQLPDSLLDRTIPPIVAELTAVDTTGAETAARDDVPMEVVAGRAEERRVDVWTLHVEGEIDRALLRQVAADAVAEIRTAGMSVAITAIGPGRGDGSDPASLVAAAVRAELARRRRSGVNVRIEAPLRGSGEPEGRGVIEIRVER